MNLDEAWVSYGAKALLAFVRTTSVQSLFSAFPDDVEAPRKEKVKKESNRGKGTKGEATKANVVDMNKPGQTSGSDNDTDKLVTKVPVLSLFRSSAYSIPGLLQERSRPYVFYSME